MSTLHVQDLEIPSDVFTLEGFRNWVAGLDESAPLVSFCAGNVHIEMSPQNYRSHTSLTAEITSALVALARDAKLGMFCPAPSWFTCEGADLSTEPDGFLATYASLRSKAIAIHPAREHEMVGRPDMVFEAVSKTSRKKDLRDLVAQYALAGIPEYWIADARSETLEFRILVLQGDGHYHDQAGDDDGWLASPIWSRRFRLRRIVNEVGLPEFRLDQAD